MTVVTLHEPSHKRDCSSESRRERVGTKTPNSNDHQGKFGNGRQGQPFRALDSLSECKQDQRDRQAGLQGIPYCDHGAQEADDGQHRQLDGCRPDSASERKCAFLANATSLTLDGAG